jgi:hypothetical protein
VDNSHTSERWLEPMLERRLCQVAAPEELWARIQRPRATQTPSRRLPGWALALAGTGLLCMLSWLFFRGHSTPVLSPQDLAIQALARGEEDLDLRVDTVSAIRSWVKSRTGFDIPIASPTAQEVRLTGVCAVRGGAPAIEVAYRVRGHNAALLVSQGSQPTSVDGKHQFLKCESIGKTRVSSWTMRGQLYTLAYASHSDLRDECLLCHSGTEQLTLRN